MPVPRDAAKGELRVFLTLENLQPQFAAYMGTPVRARGYPPYAGQHALIIEVAPGLMIERVMDLALKADPDLEPGILFVERQFGILEIHGDDKEKLLAAGRAVLKGMGLTEGDQLAPRILFTDVIESDRRPARGDHQPQPPGLHGDAGGNPAGVRNGASTLRGDRRQCRRKRWRRN